MEPPTDLGADSIRDEKVKVVRSLRRWSRNEVAANVVRGQYAEGAIQRRTGRRLSPGTKRQSGFANRNFRRVTLVHRQLALGRRAGLHARRKTASEIGNGHFHSLQKAPAVLFNKDLSDLKCARDPDSARRRNLVADSCQGARHELSHRAGENGFPLRDVFRQSQPGSLRTFAARCDERRRHAVCARATRSRKPGRSSIPIEEAWHAKRMRPNCFLSCRIVGTGGSG